MHGVTTAIVAFIFAGVIWPHLIKHKVQFYAALITVVFIILFDSLAHIFPSTARAFYGVNGLLQIGAIVLLVLSAGMSARDLGGEVLHTIDVVRRGGEKETIIVPLRGEKPKPRGGDVGDVAGTRIDLTRDIAAEEAALDAAEKAAAPAPSPAPAKKPETDSSIPLE